MTGRALHFQCGRLLHLRSSAECHGFGFPRQDRESLCCFVEHDLLCYMCEEAAFMGVSHLGKEIAALDVSVFLLGLHLGLPVAGLILGAKCGLPLLVFRVQGPRRVRI